MGKFLSWAFNVNQDSWVVIVVTVSMFAVAFGWLFTGLLLSVYVSGVAAAVWMGLPVAYALLCVWEKYKRENG
jgi:hypothetical protein